MMIIAGPRNQKKALMVGIPKGKFSRRNSIKRGKQKRVTMNPLVDNPCDSSSEDNLPTDTSCSKILGKPPIASGFQLVGDEEQITRIFVNSRE